MLWETLLAVLTLAIQSFAPRCVVAASTVQLRKAFWFFNLGLRSETIVVQTLPSVRESLTLEKGPLSIAVKRFSFGNVWHALCEIIERRFASEGGRLPVDECKAVLL